MHKKLLFKIHLILGLTAGVVLLIIGLTGAILSFQTEIINSINKDSYIVEVQESKRLSAKELLEKFQEKLPSSKINSFTFSQDEKSSFVINVAEEGKAARKGVNYYINPYTAELLPNVKGEGFFKFVENIHRRLAIGDVGKQIVAISVVSLLLLMISGIYIYWGRIKNAFFSSFTFKFKHKGRAFLSTMHSALGLWVIPFYLLTSLTGLSWSYEWFNNSLHSIAGVKAEKRMPPKKQEIPESFDNIQKAVELFNKNVNSYEKSNIRFNSDNSVYTFNYLSKNPLHDRAMNKIELNIETNEVLKHEIFDDKPLNEKLMKSILALHTGEFFGIIGKIFMFITSSLMALFTITGFMMYIQRKKKKSKNKAVV
jgi:sulfite reductase (NADPH) flavoprotein alpha-component